MEPWSHVLPQGRPPALVLLGPPGCARGGRLRLASPPGHRQCCTQMPSRALLIHLTHLQGRRSLGELWLVCVSGRLWLPLPFSLRSDPLPVTDHTECPLSNQGEGLQPQSHPQPHPWLSSCPVLHPAPLGGTLSVLVWRPLCITVSLIGAPQPPGLCLRDSHRAGLWM